ncbi:hypothetical protein bAD24_III11895 [Burkholderia sp. AD24]|nr:hypothetical protein bAD24_III11895 [Burkholderia sp. AD24]
MPWVAERLALWALRDKPTMYGRTPMQPADLVNCMNLAWKESDSIGALNGANSLDLIVRSVLLAQVPHQTNHGMGDFARQIDLLDNTDPQSKLRNVLDSALSIPADTYLQLAIPFWLRSEEKLGDVFAPAYLRALQDAFGAATLQSFLRTFIFERRRVCEDMMVVADDEWFQPNLMYRYPFVMHNRERFFWGTPGLRRHFEYSFSDIVVRSDESRARDSFEKWFEQYVGKSLRRTGGTVLSEDEVRRRFAVVGPCCDFAVITPNAAVLFEVKNKALVHTLPASGLAGTYRSKLRATVLKAAAQLDNVETHVARFPEFLHAKIHKVTVTYGDLFLGSGKFLFDDKSDDDLPHIMSLDQLDRLVEAVRLGQCALDDFFSEFRRRQHVPADRLFSPAQLLEYAPFRLDERPSHIADIFNRFLETLFDKLGADGEVGVKPMVLTA